MEFLYAVRWRLQQMLVFSTEESRIRMEIDIIS